MTNEQNKLAEIRARVEKATSGPWQFDGCSVTNWHEQTFEMEWLPNGKGNDGYREVNTNWRNDGELLSSARTDIPYLLDLVAAKEERIVELDSLTDELRRRLDLASTFSDMQSERIAELEKDLGEASSEALVQSYAREGAEERIKELEAERDAGKKKFDEMCFDMSLLRQSKESAESQVASLREALERIEALCNKSALGMGFLFLLERIGEINTEARVILGSTKGDGQNG